MNLNETMYYNVFGGFTKDGKEYKIKISHAERTPLPWSHIIANEKIGTLITSNGGGYTWYGNSRENKITTWSNNQISDKQSEIIYIKKDDNIYTATPIKKISDFNITYGFGYATYETKNNDFLQELTIFVPKEKEEKLSILKLKNLTNKEIKLKVFYCIEPVLGVSREQTKKHLWFAKNNNCIEAHNNYREHYSESTTYISSSEKIIKATCERKMFCEGEIKEEIFGIAKDPFITIEIELQLKENEEKEIYFSLGQEKNINYTNTKTELEETKEYWNNLIGDIEIKTPVESMNILMNGWLLYQTIVSRLLARTSFYQAGGAYGFRDQLQDILCLIITHPEIAKKQIIYHAKHQFKEGDVLHWWHPENDKGIRTRYRDDLLWLPYVVSEYIEITKDENILNEIVPYIEGRILKENEDEIYDEVKESEIKGSLYEHCIKAIEKSLTYGKHGLPQMGGGDWNDGMNKVEGESVWLGFFLYSVLDKFTKICEIKNDIKTKEKYENEMIKLKEALNKNGWDGKWFRRAYFKDGQVLGSAQNDECKIDGISQSWAVISNAVDKEKQEIAMNSLDDYLVDRENMIIKLLDPPFNKSNLKPGYIKAYIPGVRENGGQYTHGAVWAIIANALLKNGDKAEEYFRILNPIEHTRTKQNVEKYKVEPYVVSADVYSSNNLEGRGGWTWYTGSSSWLYVAGLKYILGFQKRGNKLKIEPTIPKEWNGFEIDYKYGNSLYKIIVQKGEEKKIYLDNNLIDSGEIDLEDDGKSHTAEVVI